jgi:carbamoyl-phosphate synthase large subunit
VGDVEGEDEAIAAAREIGYPVLVRPSYVLGGRAMRICDDETELRAAMAAVSGPVLVDRFVENAIEIDVDALCDGEDVFVAAVMQHVEEAGVHSGDSSCVLPAQSLTLANALEVEHVVRRLGPALGVVGLLNVQLAIADSTVYVLEANPRASRTVPFASKAIGLNLVEAACRLAHGDRLDSLGLRTPRPTEVSVKAAVLPFSRFPGRRPRARARDALDRRGDGDRVRPADRVRERPSGRRTAASRRRASPSSRSGTETSRASRRSRRRSQGSTSSLVATTGTARPCARRARGGRGGEGRRCADGGRHGRRPDPRAPLRSRRHTRTGSGAGLTAT